MRLPKLKKVDHPPNEPKYKLSGTRRQRRLALDFGVEREMKKTGKTRKNAAVAKKRRLNVLRIYRRFDKISECKIITEDMRYLDRKYDIGKTNDIC